MFFFHSAVSLGLIALACGVALLIWSMRHEGKGTCLAKFFGYVITIIAALGIICSIYSAVHMWRMYHMQHQMMMKGMQQQTMMQSTNNPAPAHQR